MVNHPHALNYLDDGLGPKSKARYKKRRSILAHSIGHLIVVYGISDPPGHPHVWAMLKSPIFQEPLLLFLTGINQTQIALCLDPHSSDSKEILFIPQKDLNKEFWEGIQLGTGTIQSNKEIQQLTGIQDIRDISELESSIKERLKSTQDRSLGTFWHQSKHKKVIKDSNFKFKQKLKRWIRNEKPAMSLMNISSVLWPQRTTLDGVDQKNSEKANKLASLAFKKACQNLKEMKNEMEVSSFLEGELTSVSPFGLSFPTISASGANASILHYTRNNDSLKKGNLLLLDFGVRWYGMHADISRTVPINGQFNPLQSKLYQIVLDAQAQVEHHVKPGVTIEILNHICWKFINEALASLMFRIKGKYSVSYQTQPHHVSHLIGLQVHD
ncbi:MAG: aminopeptidase P N-terminal domain-containing protein, partial [Candidatus Margulisbacteria bacterium]|nr:aminopeptidase P N-terminal domain-containing protein [Candidatus Margulisiibacteriota bacterium]